MKPAALRIAHGIGELIWMTFLALTAFAVVYFDVVVLDHRVSEASATGILQEVLLFSTALIFWVGAWKLPQQRGFLILVAGFFSCALVREMDSFLDLIADGFWIWPANLIAIASVAYVITYCRKSVLQPMADFIGSRPYFYIQFGLVTLLIFSRTFGSGRLIWNTILDPKAAFELKSALQEGLELFGYVFITHGAVAFVAQSLQPHIQPLAMQKIASPCPQKNTAA
ncbi:MAG: hypothetical protein RBS84_09690 [Kiritimatiellia bacterium]|jgi:hypothetical protein|nr:hypothetical protein [Kiritimatiellia bacterium]